MPFLSFYSVFVFQFEAEYHSFGFVFSFDVLLKTKFSSVFVSTLFCLYFLELFSTEDSVPGGSDDDFLFHLQEKIPQTPRPLSGRSPREALSPTGTTQHNTAFSNLEIVSHMLQDNHALQGEPCRTTTPSSGHFSAGSKVSSPSPPGNQV